MYYANKGNKQYPVRDDAERRSYLANGFDVIDGNGEIVEHSPLKSIPYNEYAALKRENDELRELVGCSNSGAASTQTDSLAGMDVGALRAYAAERNINLGNATSIKGISDKIRAAEEAARIKAEEEAAGNSNSGGNGSAAEQ
jgi:hypothetical protein